MNRAQKNTSVPPHLYRTKIADAISRMTNLQCLSFAPANNDQKRFFLTMLRCRPLVFQNRGTGPDYGISRTFRARWFSISSKAFSPFLERHAVTYHLGGGNQALGDKVYGTVPARVACRKIEDYVADLELRGIPGEGNRLLSRQADGADASLPADVLHRRGDRLGSAASLYDKDRRLSRR